jgi:hypothetical protein
VTVLEARERSLTDAEQRLIDRQIRGLASQSVRQRRALSVGIVAVFVLWALTLVASDAPWWVVTAFWLVVGAVIVVWVHRDLRATGVVVDQMRIGLESARRHNRARVVDVRSRAFAEFEEVDDEGACYAFEVAGPRLVFIVGQQYYAEARFPSLDFSLVEILDESGGVASEHLEKRGPRAKPALVVPAATKLTLRPPEHLEVVEGSVVEVETIMAAWSASPESSPGPQP